MITGCNHAVDHYICAKCELTNEVDRLQAENARLRAVYRTGQELLNHLQCFSCGVAVMAEPEMAELFGKYTDAVEAWHEEKRGTR